VALGSATIHACERQLPQYINEQQKSKIISPITHWRPL